MNQKLQIVWEVDDVFTSFSQSNKSCSCKGGCDGSRPACKNCFRACKPCTLKCKCKLSCRNPHNDGGKCPRCACNPPPAVVCNDVIVDNTLVIESSDDEDTDDEQNDDMTMELPIIPSISGSIDEVDSDSDSNSAMEAYSA